MIFIKTHKKRKKRGKTSHITNPREYILLNSYIHGGAWRDPTETSSAFDLASSILLANPETTRTPNEGKGTLASIKGLASISYRLSAHPNFPQDRTSTPVNEFRDAKHPDHVSDVAAAVSFLQQKYRFGERYILVGHSCGATMAFQCVMPGVAKGLVAAGQPTAILGVAGIYDLSLLRDKHSHISAYQDFIEGAFGNDETGVWDVVSPARVKGEDGVETGWESGRLAVLARSVDDELVDSSQVEAVGETLAGWEKAGSRGKNERKVIVLPLHGAHDDAWKKGEELARAITVTLRELQIMGLGWSP